MKRKTFFCIGVIITLVSLNELVDAAPIESPYVTGIVFEDTNGNGIRDEGEPGVAGVMVSNQRDVVLTDSDGRYYLPIEDNMTIFVTKPAGYQFPLDENNLPQFYYHHYPQGSPDYLEYPGIEPSGTLPDSVDFALYQVEESENFTFMAMADPQPRTDYELDYFRDFVVAALPDDIAVLNIALGDLMFDLLELFPRYNEVMGRLNMPLYNAPGNHDLNFEAGADHCWDTFKRYYGPEYFSFTYGKTHFMVLDTVEWDGKQTEQWWNDYGSSISPDQMTWIENNLKHIPDDHLLVFSAHIPLRRELYSGNRHEVQNREEFFRLVEDREHLLFLAGHLHTNKYTFLGPEHGWHGQADFPHIVCGAVCGAWWSGPKNIDGIPAPLQPDGSPSGLFLFHVEGNQFTDVFYPLGLHPDYQMRISSPVGTLEVSELADTPIITNVFIGNERTSVVASLNGEEIPMERNIQPDPFFAKLLNDNRDLFKSWVGPHASTHIWRADMPEELEPGVYRLDIAATIHDGRVMTGSTVFEVVENKD